MFSLRLNSLRGNTAAMMQRALSQFAGQPIVCKAAVARGVNDLRIEEITVGTVVLSPPLSFSIF